MRLSPNRTKTLGALIALSIFAQAFVACQGGTPERNQAPTSNPGSVALVVYDAGETLGLLPVASRLQSTGFQIRWIPLTPWSADLLAANGQSFLQLPAGIEEMAHLHSREAEADPGFWEEAILQDPPDLVVSGMVSAIQGQLAVRMRDAGVGTRGFHDGFQPPGAGAISVQTAPYFDQLWVPTARVRQGFLAQGFESVVAGQPSLEAWRRSSEEVEKNEVRQRLGVADGDRILVFAGQYGPGYEEVLDSFLGAMRSTLVSDPKVQLVVSHHPRTDGSVERGALERAELPRAAMAPERLPTMELATASEVVLTWTSTVGVQAAFMGKQVIYFSPPPDFESDLVEEGAAFQANEATLALLLAEILQNPKTPSPSGKPSWTRGMWSMPTPWLRSWSGKGWADSPSSFPRPN